MSEATPEQRPKKGIRCGRCNTPIRKVETVRPGDNEVVRYRKCPRCGKTNGTVEVPLSARRTLKPRQA